MGTNVVKLRDTESGAMGNFEVDSGKLFDDAGNLIRQMTPGEETILGPKGRSLGHASMLSDYAARTAAARYADQIGRPVPMRDWEGNGHLVTMDLGIADVHTNATLPNYAAGYKIADGVADIASPPILVPKASDVFYTWNVSSDFNRKLGNTVSPAGAVGEVNPTTSNSTYTTVNYALGGFIPTEVMSNADAPLKPFQKLVQVVVDALLLEREYRVVTLMQASANWNAGLVQTLASGAQWDGGASSDPVANLHTAIENSYLPVTAIIWSEKVEHAFVRNPAVQKYVGFKSDVDGIPTMEKFSASLKLPPIYTARMKYTTNGGTLTYLWGNHVVLLHEPKERPPTNQMDVATSYTFRWNGGEAPDGTMTGGFLVRTYYDPKRGGRGGTQVVVVHNDAEVMTSQLVGGLILNAFQ